MIRILCTGDSHTWGEGVSGMSVGIYSEFDPPAVCGELRLANFCTDGYVNVLRRELERATGSYSKEWEAKDIAAKVTDAIVMADDSGLVVDALNGEPGIYSARYLGEDTSYSIKNANIIKRLEGLPVEKRTARFVCAIAAVLPDGRVLSTEGVIEGYIGYEERGNGGFGYDPIFMVPEYGCSTAELSDKAKNAISHRGKALEAMKIKLQEELEL